MRKISMACKHQIPRLIRHERNPEGVFYNPAKLMFKSRYILVGPYIKVVCVMYMEGSK
jgi:hypothetical protein